MNAQTAASLSPLQAAIRYDTDGLLWVYSLRRGLLGRAVGKDEDQDWEILDPKQVEEFDDWEPGLEEYPNYNA